MKFLSLVLLVFIVSLPATAQVSVMSYNIRYATESDGENAWSQRKEYLASQIAFYEPGIFGVQEALLAQLEYLEGELDHYSWFGEGRDGGKGGEYSAIFYNTDLFEVLAENTFWLSETPGVPSIGWDAALNRICTYGHFREKTSGKEFFVFNTHFDHLGKEARSKSAELLMEQIKKINSEDLPVILMGDFNLEPDSPELAPVLKLLNDSEAVASLVFGPEGTFNGFKFGEPVTKRIDYVFTSKKGVDVLKYAVLSDSKNLKYPSDHFPVYVLFEIEGGNFSNDKG